MLTFPSNPSPTANLQMGGSGQPESLNAVFTFRGDTQFLSNFYPAPITYLGIDFPATENAYFAGHLLEDAELQRSHLATLSPSQAKAAFGRGNQMGTEPAIHNAKHPRAHETAFKLAVMLDVNRLKFATHPNLRAQLLATGHALLVEGTTWGDEFWGINLYTGAGTNYLGRVQMAIRWEDGIAPLGNLTPDQLLPLPFYWRTDPTGQTTPAWLTNIDPTS